MLASLLRADIYMRAGRPAATIITIMLIWENITGSAPTDLFNLIAVLGAAGGDELRQLQDHGHHALAAEPERGARLQRLRSLLQTSQCE